MFDPVSLDEMNEVKLLNRTDKKYTFPATNLHDILTEASESYRILTINNIRYSHYETRYYDTPDYEMYTQHHNGKLNRNKVRFRTYLDSDIHFFEIKFKSNKGRTIKTRVRRNPEDFTITTDAEALLKRTPYESSELREAIRVYYTRITLVRKDMKERLTLDLNLNYDLNGKTTSFDEMIIAEVKQDKTENSPFREIMKKRRIKDISISKYCLGIACLAPHVKKNNFKIKLHYVNKLCHVTA